MEIFINDRKVEINMKNKDIKTLIEDLQKMLLDDGKVLSEIKINGKKIVNEKILIDENIEIIEIQTKTKREFIIETLYYVQKHIDRFYEILDESQEEITNNQVYEVITFLEWLLGLLFSMKETTSIAFIYEDFDDYLMEFKSAVEGMIDAFKVGDIETVISILDMEIIQFVEAFEENSEGYLIEIIDEDIKMKNLN